MLIGIGTAEDDVRPRVPALESRQGDAYSDVALWGRLLILVLERDLDVHCTSATDEELPLVLAIEVDEDLPC